MVLNQHLSTSEPASIVSDFAALSNLNRTLPGLIPCVGRPVKRLEGRTLLQHALLALLEQPAVVSLIVGVKHIEQLEGLIAAVR
jgi:aryl-alcohol dehydrogenase-like predicted oxidoreductase